MNVFRPCACVLIIPVELFKGKFALSGLMRRRVDRQAESSKTTVSSKLAPNLSKVPLVEKAAAVLTKPAPTLLNKKKTTASSSLCQPLPWPELPTHTFDVPGKDFKEAGLSFPMIF